MECKALLPLSLAPFDGVCQAVVLKLLLRGDRKTNFRYPDVKVFRVGHGRAGRTINIVSIFPPTKRRAFRASSVMGTAPK